MTDNRMTKICVNCTPYDWPTEDITVFRCSNCRFLSYCSPECQKEHWKKVHRKQCKTLAGQVEVPASTHLPNSCPGCKEEEELGTESINSQDCPAWGCLVGPGVKRALICGKFPSAVEPGEIARNFPTKIEHTLFVMQQIVHKLMRTNSGPRLSEECRAQMTELAKMLAKKRIEFIIKHHLLPAKMMGNHPWSFPSNWEEFLKAVASSVFNVSSNLGTSAGDPFLAMETLKLLAGFLSNDQWHICHKNFERVSMEADISSDVWELVAKLGSSTKVEEIWDSVLGALKAGLVHHHILLDILCGGNRKQVCSQCLKSVVIERVCVPFIGGGSTFEKPFVTFKTMDFSCAAMDCQVASRRKAINLQNLVKLVMILKVDALGGTVCDNCFLCSRSVHRCSQCMTKVYCSEECQLEDWKKVHEKVCNEGDVAKKVKGGKLERVDVVKKRKDKYVADYVADIENDPEMNPAMKQMCLNFVEKIQ